MRLRWEYTWINFETCMNFNLHMNRFNIGASVEPCRQNSKAWTKSITISSIANLRLVIFYWCKCYDVILAIHTAPTIFFYFACSISFPRSWSNGKHLNDLNDLKLFHWDNIACSVTIVFKRSSREQSKRVGSQQNVLREGRENSFLSLLLPRTCLLRNRACPRGSRFSREGCLVLLYSVPLRLALISRPNHSWPVSADLIWRQWGDNSKLSTTDVARSSSVGRHFDSDVLAVQSTKKWRIVLTRYVLHLKQETAKGTRMHSWCRLFSRGAIFTRARVSLALLSLRKNGGLLVV